MSQSKNALPYWPPSWPYRAYNVVINTSEYHAHQQRTRKASAFWARHGCNPVKRDLQHRKLHMAQDSA